MQSTTIVTRRLFSVLITVILLSTIVMAQSSVKIKSRVEIKPDSKHSKQGSIGQLKKTSDETDFAILPRSGTIDIGFNLVTVIDPPQGDETITVVVGGKSYSYNLSSSVELWSQSYGCSCNYRGVWGYCNCLLPVYEYISYGAFSNDPDPRKISIPVHAKDTIRIFYSGIPKPYLIEIGEEYSWYMYLGFEKPIIKPFCTCDYQWSNDGNKIYPYWREYSPVELNMGANYRPEIMLGESKYLQACWDERYQQVYWASDWTDTPDHVGDPLTGVAFTVEPVGSSKCGVYWEQLNDQGDLDSHGDMIRLIGRYWEKDSTYAVKVTAKVNGKTTTTDAIYTMAPAKLLTLDPLQSPDYTNVKDVFANPSGNPNLNLDALIIKYAGENGIPPQYIKGQMLKETTVRPAWRYEPFADAKYQKLDNADDYFDEGMPFVVTETSMGGDLPVSHTNAYSGRDINNVTPYIDAPVYIGSYATQHWNNYVRHKSGNEPDQIIGSSTLTNRWKELYKEAKKNRTLTDAQARTEAHTTLTNEINNPNTTIGKRYDIVAQTRKSTSYGFIQMMYITAADNRFFKETDNRYELTGTRYVDQSDVLLYTEKLNEQDFFMPRYCDFLLKKLNSKFPGRIPSSQWITTKDGIRYVGFEANWKAAIRSYNSGETNYAIDVLTNAQKFLPQNK